METILKPIKTCFRSIGEAIIVGVERGVNVWGETYPNLHPDLRFIVFVLSIALLMWISLIISYTLEVIF